jgi:hypothetical protein
VASTEGWRQPSPLAHAGCCPIDVPLYCRCRPMSGCRCADSPRGLGTCMSPSGRARPRAQLRPCRHVLHPPLPLPPRGAIVPLTPGSCARAPPLHTAPSRWTCSMRAMRGHGSALGSPSTSPWSGCGIRSPFPSRQAALATISTVRRPPALSDRTNGLCYLTVSTPIHASPPRKQSPL